MPNPVPSTYFPSISISANNEIVFSVDSAGATFPLLSNAEANLTTGDIRDMAYAMLMGISQRHGVSSPVPVQSSAADSISNSDFPNYVRDVTITFNLEPSGTEELADEP